MRAAKIVAFLGRNYLSIVVMLVINKNSMFVLIGVNNPDRK